MSHIGVEERRLQAEIQAVRKASALPKLMHAGGLGQCTPPPLGVFEVQAQCW